MRPFTPSPLHPFTPSPCLPHPCTPHTHRAIILAPELCRQGAVSSRASSATLVVGCFFVLSRIFSGGKRTAVIARPAIAQRVAACLLLMLLATACAATATSATPDPTAAAAPSR